MFNSEWQLYVNTEEAWKSMLADCSNAKTSIDLEQYIFKANNIGLEFIELFKKKNREGVRVRILLDMAGSHELYSSPVPEELRKEGIEIRFFNIISLWRLGNISSWFFRDHRKILVVDKNIAYTGGVGVSDHMDDWRDTMGKTEDNAVKEISDSFEEMWQTSQSKNWLARAKRYREVGKKLEFITNGPYVRKRFLYHTLIDEMRGAKNSINITTPYFIPDRRLSRVLILAANRGVNVKILLPEKTDVPIVNIAAQSYFEKFLKKGIRIFRYQPVIMHAKTVVVDHAWATFGSFNLDSLSFLYNYEANIVTIEHECVANISEHFDLDLTKAKEITLSDWQNRPFLEKMKEFFCLYHKKIPVENSRKNYSTAPFVVST